MATLGHYLEQVSLGGTQGTVGAYLRQAPSGKNWFQYRFQAAGTAGTFVSPTTLAKELGTAFIGRIQTAVLTGLSKIPLRKFESKAGVTAVPLNLPVKTGAFAIKPTLAMPGITGGFNVSGQYGQVLLVMQRAETFQQYGPLALETSVNIEMVALMKGLVEAIKKIAASVVTKAVYETPAQVLHFTNKESTTTKLKTLGQFLSEKSISQNKWRFGEYNRTYNLLKAVQEGIRQISSYGIIIGIDEEMLETDSGVPYSMFVEHGHRVVFPGVGDIGSYVEPRPFMGEIFKQIEEFLNEFWLLVKSKGLDKVIGDTVFSWINNIRGAVGIGKSKGVKMFRPDMDFPYNQAEIKTPITNQRFLREYF